MFNRKIYAFTLVELLVAILLGSLLLTGLMKIMLSIKRSYNLENSLSRMQESARVIHFLIGQRIHMAAYSACDEHEENLNQQAAINGFDSRQLPTYGLENTKKGSDVLMLGNCLSYHNKQQFLKIYYYLADTGRRNFQKQPIYALFQQPVMGTRQELVPNVFAMKVSYGMMALDHKYITRYVAADLIEDWRQVGAVKIDFLLRSKKTVLHQPHAYDFNHQHIEPTDKFLYKAFEIYVALRERMA